MTVENDPCLVGKCIVPSCGSPLHEMEEDGWKKIYCSSPKCPFQIIKEPKE